MTQLTLIKSKPFGEIECDFWRDKKKEILMTREQIGSALEYSFPNDSIRKIHERNSDRLDCHSVSVKLTGTDGKLYDTFVYTTKGIYEICRLSRQPKADAFMDWVWDAIEAIRKTGTYTKTNSFPWLDSMGAALRREGKITGDLPKVERIRVRAKMLRQTQEETGHDYSDIIAILETSADNMERKALQTATKAEAKEARAEAKTISGQARQAIDWLKTEYTEAIPQEKHLLVRYDHWKMWAGKHRLNLTLVLRELHRQGVIEIMSEGKKLRYASGKRIDGKLFNFVWVKKEYSTPAPSNVVDINFRS